MYNLCTKSFRFQGYLLTNGMEYFLIPVKKWALLSCQCYIQTLGKTLHVHTCAACTHEGYISIYILVKPRPLDIMYTHIQSVETPFTQKHHHSTPHSLSLSLSLSMREKAFKTKVSILFALGMTHGYKSRCTLWSSHDTYVVKWAFKTRVGVHFALVTV